jgi:hypothetical protein
MRICLFTPIFLFSMGILRRIKGFDVFLRAFKKVSEVQPELSLLIAGEGKGRRRKTWPD